MTPKPKHTRIDYVVALILMLAAFPVAFHAQKSLHVGSFLRPESQNLWFDGDPDRVITTDLDRGSREQARSNVHPLFSLSVYGPIAVLRKVCGFPDLTAVMIFHSAAAGLWLAAFFLLIRAFGCRLLDSLLISAVGGTCGAAMFWTSVPETWVFGSLSLFPALFLATDESSKESGWRAAALASLCALGITVTNWLTGLAATAGRLSFKRFVKINALVLTVVVGLSFAQKLIFPRARGMLQQSQNESRYAYMPTRLGPLATGRSFFVHSVVSSAYSKIQIPPRHEIVMSLEPSRLFTGSAFGKAATVLWMLLLLAGFGNLILMKERRILRMVLAISIIGQLTLHMVYGRETFLYALHYAPLLICVVALTTLSRFRPLVVGSLAAFLILNATNNLQRWRVAREYALNYFAALPAEK